MKIPDELKGKEVKKLEKWIIQYLFDNAGNTNGIIQNLTLSHIVGFHNQDFTPDMIEKYFEGWIVNKQIKGYQENKTGMAYYFEFTEKELIIRYHFVERARISLLFIKTLSDFIDVSLNSGIKLKWRE